MALYKIETQADSEIVEIDSDDREKIKNILREYIQRIDYYYVDRLLDILKEKGFKVRKLRPIKINWWEIQPVKDIDKTVEIILKD